MSAEEIPITEAARRLGIDYHQCRRLVLRGELRGGRDEFGRLFVSRLAIDRRLDVGEHPHEEPLS